MPTAIRDIELSGALAGFDLDGCDRCMLVFRWRGVVAGRAFVTVTEGRVSASAILDAAQRQLTPDALRVWLEEVLAFDERAGAEAGDLTATVAICTRERPDDLARALRAVSTQCCAPAEILVVDNAPRSAATREVVASVPGVRYVVEPQPGLNRARNRALREAAGDVVLFTDDDASPEPDWVSALVAAFRDPRVLCATGLTLPLELQTPAQELFEEHCSFTRGFARRVFDGRVDHRLMVSAIGAGANMAMRRSAVAQVGAFDERLDAGTPTRSGGDHDMFTRVLTAGYRIVYEPRAVSWHRHRRTQRELYEVVRGYGTGVYAMWTGRLLRARDFAVLRMAWRWFVADHLPLLRNPGRLVAATGRDRLRREELLGCLAGPSAWLASHRGRGVSP